MAGNAIRDPFKSPVQGVEWVDRGDFKVPVHLVDLIDSDGIHPDQVCAVADIFTSAEEFRATMGRFAKGSEEPQVEEMLDRELARITKAREESGDSGEIVDWANGLINRLPPEQRGRLLQGMISRLEPPMSYLLEE